MIVTSLLVSAAAVLVGILTKLPQGGGGIVNNLMVMSFFLPNQPSLPPPLPPKDIIFDLDADIFGTRNVILLYNAMTCNISEALMPQYYTNSRPPCWTGSPSSNKVRFAAPTFALPSLSLLFLKFGNLASILITLYLPWLACTYLRLLVRTQKANDSTSIKTAISGDQWQGIELHNSLSFDLQVVLSEQSKALAELEKVTIQAGEESEKAMERVFKIERRMERLKKERDDAFEDLARGRGDLKRLGKEKKEEAEKMKKENRRQIKTWEKKEKDWEQMREKEERRHKENTDRLKMGRERERESWKDQVQRLKMEKAEEKEGMQIKIKELLKENEREKEEREKERERQQKRLEVEREEKMKALRIEAQRLEEKDSWETKKKLGQEQRIVKLEEESAKWRRKDAIENQRAKEEQQQEAATRIMSRRSGEREVEKKKYCWEEQIMEAKKLASKLEGDVLSGRKLIEDLQTDKRIDRQLLIELRAQLMRPTHMAPPTHLSPFRFGGTACAVVLGQPPHVLVTSAPSSKNCSPPQSQKVTFPSSSSSSRKTAQATLPPTLLSSRNAASPEQLRSYPSPIVRLPPASMYSCRRPIVRLPSPPPLPRQLAPSRVPKGSAPPPNAPIGPKGWTPNAKKKRH